ncbi:MAG: hypothetical protein H7141_14080 [Burkholderiales bacterium]|nr:hypothetical protein [Bacteroidia bacterium]
MKTSFFLFLFAFQFSIFSQSINEQWVKEHYTKKEYTIAMRNGVKLFTAMYAPKDNKEKHPFLIIRKPYSCEPYGEDNF